MTQSIDVAHSRSDRKVARELAKLESAFAHQSAVVACISTLTEMLMADKNQVTESMASLKQAIIDDGISDQSAVNTLVAAKAALQAQIDDAQAAGNAQHAADLQEILNQINDAKSAIQPVSVGEPGETEV